MSIFKRGNGSNSANSRKAESDAEKRARIHQITSELFNANADTAQAAAQSYKDVGAGEEQITDILECLTGLKDTIDNPLTDAQRWALHAKQLKSLADSRKDIHDALVLINNSVLTRYGLNSETVDTTLDSDILKFMTYLCASLFLLDKNLTDITASSLYRAKADSSAIILTAEKMGLDFSNEMSARKSAAFSKYANTALDSFVLLRKCRDLSDDPSLHPLVQMIMGYFTVLSSIVEYYCSISIGITSTFYVAVNNWLINQFYAIEQFGPISEQSLSYLEMTNKKMEYCSNN